MNAQVFLDTSAWFSALNDKDPDHQKTDSLYRSLVRGPQRCVTSNLVVTEMHALLLNRLGRAVALAFLDSLDAQAAHEVRFVSREVETAAVDRWLRPFRDQRFSLADAVSFEIMHREGIRAAFALDRHFAAAGFDLLPG